MATNSILRPGELKDILLREIASADLATADVSEVGTVLEVRDGVARIYGLQSAVASEMLEFTAHETGETVAGLVLNLEEDNVGAAIMGDYLKLKEGDEVRRHRPPARGAGRCRDAGTGRGCARASRWTGGADHPDHARSPGRDGGAGHHRAPAGQGAAPDRHQGDRRDDPDRPWPARADHRRPRHRQDGDRGRHHHQSEGHRRRLRLRGDRPEALDGRDGGGEAQGNRRDGLHHRGRRLRVRPRAAPVHRPVHRLRHRRVLHVRGGQGHPLRLRRPLQAGRGLPPALADPAPSPGPRGVSGRRLLSPQPPARARRQDLR